MWERTITFNSGGKAFTNPGWRIGWMIAPEHLLWGPQSLLVGNFATPGCPLQIAYAMAMERELDKWGKYDSYFITARDRLRRNRNKMVKILKSVGAEVIAPAAGYTVLGVFNRLSDRIDLNSIMDTRPGIRIWKSFLIKNVRPRTILGFYS